MSNIKEVLYKQRLHVSQPISWSMAAILLDFAIAVDVVVSMRPRAIPLAMITMRKISSWISFSFLYEYGAPLSGLRAAGALLIYIHM